MRSLRILGVLLCTLFALNSGVAWATTVSFEANCDNATFDYLHWSVNPIDVREIVTVDGHNVYDQVTAVAKPHGWPSTAVYQRPIPYPTPLGPGDHTVYLEASFLVSGRKQTFKATLPVHCEGCVRGEPDPAGAHASGEAFGAYIDLLDGTIKLSMQPKTSSFESGVGTTTNSTQMAKISMPPLVELSVAPVSSSSAVTADPAQATNISVSQISKLSLLNGLITADTVRAVAQAQADGDSSAYTSAGSTFQNLFINGKQWTNVPPNTKVNLPHVKGLIGWGSYVVLHERIGTASGPAPDVLSGGQYVADMEVNMLHVVVNPPTLGGKVMEITVSHATAHADFLQTKSCPGDNPGNTVSGHAYTLFAGFKPVPDFDLNTAVNAVKIEPTGGITDASVNKTNIPDPRGDSFPDLLQVQVAQAHSEGQPTADGASSFSFAKILGLDLMGMLQADLVHSQANSTADSSSQTSTDAGTEFAGLVVNGTPHSGEIPPNTVIPLGIGFVILNEQTVDAVAAGHTGLTVRAVHLVIPKLGINVIVNEAHSDATVKTVE